ncbi:VRR-NUC domain-containing protein [Prescottella equi]|uniref:VRR-NUC domain-containing protein n=1 Tax=Rhodococcus hoagii TaxID=43767 RepID=UPI001F5B5EB2|nr:VRR-NUC domain-containing protein [Prescottella equi]UNQ40917.1 VRR-NUC domain-containing protein [Prescottella equi]
MSFPLPTEDEEQRTVVQFLELVGLRFSHIPMSTYTTSIKVKMRNHHLGVRPGVPDLLVVIPSHRAKDGKGRVLFLEMKRRKGGRLSSDQQDWIDALNALGVKSVSAHVCPGAERAIEVINQYLKPSPNVSPF